MLCNILPARQVPQQQSNRGRELHFPKGINPTWLLLYFTGFVQRRFAADVPRASDRRHAACLDLSLADGTDQSN